MRVEHILPAISTFPYLYHNLYNCALSKSAKRFPLKICGIIAFPHQSYKSALATLIFVITHCVVEIFSGPFLFIFPFTNNDDCLASPQQGAREARGVNYYSATKLLFLRSIFRTGSEKYT